MKRKFRHDFTWDPIKGLVMKCAVIQCDQDSIVDGFCKLHYEKRKQDLNICLQPGCRRRIAFGATKLCSQHYDLFFMHKYRIFLH